MDSQAHILVVDDIAENREILVRRLAQMGHAATEAGGGREALACLERAPFDLILLDITMPGMNGYEVLERLRDQERWRRIPVVVISAVAEMESVVRCVELGAEDYLFKPFNAVLLKARVGACLEKKRLRDHERAMLDQIKAEQTRSEALLLSIFPRAIADRLRAGPTTIAQCFAEVTVLFADLHDFSRITAKSKPEDIVAALNTVYSAFDDLAARHGVEKIKTVGDAYMAVAGLPDPRKDHAAAAADLALAMQQQIAELELGLPEPLSLRIGMNSGPVVAGVIGTSKPAYDLWGSAVGTAAQMEAFGLGGSIQVTAATHQHLRDAYVFEERGTFYVKGRGEVSTYLLKGKRR